MSLPKQCDCIVFDLRFLQFQQGFAAIRGRQWQCCAVRS